MLSHVEVIADAGHVHQPQLGSNSGSTAAAAAKAVFCMQRLAGQPSFAYSLPQELKCAYLGVQVAHIYRGFLVTIMGMLSNEVGAHASCDAPTSHRAQRHCAIWLLALPHAA